MYNFAINKIKVVTFIMIGYENGIRKVLIR